MPDTLLPFAAVVVETRAGRFRTVNTVRDAAEMLLSDDWPEEGRGGRGGVYRLTVRVCLAALEGRISADKAREAFIAAADEAGIFVREASRKG